MRKQRDKKAEATIAIRLWTYAGARQAVPYLRSLVRSLREGWLEMRQAQEQVRKIEARPGRADRDSLILLEETNHDLTRAEAKLEDIINEMVALSAYCVDPGAGLAVIPFLSNGVLAWFIFDLFDEEGLVAWRLNTDPLETRRSLSDIEDAVPSVPGLKVADSSQQEQTGG
jgi:hypothetical protein